MKSLVIEGWRGISHSYSIVNSYQIAELSKFGNYQLAHKDVPFVRSNWNPVDNDPGFPEEIRSAANALQPGSADLYDCAYRIAWPFRRPESSARTTLTFMTAECGLDESDFPPGENRVADFLENDHRLITPSCWSKMKLEEFGFPSDRIEVIPHGVAPNLFRPAPEYDRTEFRKQIGATPENFVFLNLGAMSWNKGIDILMPAFIDIRRRHPHVRLVLKDDQRLYGLSAKDVIQRLAQIGSIVLDLDTIASITLISATLDIQQMRMLYASADAYVSPYRAEGFNMPVMEAIACGTPVVVTAGGATDDFCDNRTSRKIKSVQVPNTKMNLQRPGYHLEPNIASLIDEMESVIAAGQSGRADFEAGRQKLIANFNWSAVTEKLAGLL